VVFRGFREETNQLQFVTDTRSAKVAQLGLNPWAEACWYFTQTREQFRILGALQVITSADTEGILIQLWQKLSPAAREQFAGSHPGKPLEENPSVSYPISESAPAPNFAVLLLDPIEVDHLELRGNPQQRQHYWLGESAQWLEARVNP
jgi:PPOX class probable FMN-dependent enzyme